MDPTRGSRLPRRTIASIAILAMVALGIAVAGQQTRLNGDPAARRPAIEQGTPGPGTVSLTAPTRWTMRAGIRV
jgi:hypothetical protein